MNQRLCPVPDGDLFGAIRDGRATVVTDRIERFTPTGPRLAAGRDLEADVVVTATGSRLLALGGIRLTVDGQQVALPRTMTYKGMMTTTTPWHRDTTSARPQVRAQGTERGN
ncbi:hypothetical protein [Nocardia asiatica]|uniref:hypothetical protein n=1 Tax=Nocardia asiatica TaxID=209252 RepID=UPI000309D650|nr:hypothetical protein [Nocardia asiatica]